MKHQFSIVGLCNWILLISLSQSVTGNEPRDLLDLTPGEPHPDRIEINGSDPIPFDVFRSPTPDKSAFPYFVDYEVQLMKSSDIVYAVVAKRAYKTWQDCDVDEKKAKSSVEKLRSDYNFDPSQGSYHSPDSEITIQVLCSQNAASPFVVLSFWSGNRSLIAQIMKKYN